ncbi:MAG: isochorismatase family protein [Halofilum sp. (in: g-proteobacteria)]|nr:isochorismatase family protein [Halofilum sp. (in: g-proteobacteria)]
MNALALLDAERSLLLIVDMQARLVASMPDEAWGSARDATITLARGAGELDIPVLVTRQYPKGLGPTDGDIEAALPDAAVSIDKTCFSACGADELMESIRASGRDRVVVCGMEAHVCVLQTVADLAARGPMPVVVGDAVCSRRAEHRDNALARMAAGGATVTNHESVLFEWLRDARHEKFKAISALLR